MTYPKKRGEATAGNHRSAGLPFFWVLTLLSYSINMDSINSDKEKEDEDKHDIG